MPLISLIKQCGRGRDKGKFKRKTAVAVRYAIELKILILNQKIKAY